MSYLTWKQFKDTVEAELTKNNLEDIEIHYLDLWQPKKETIKVSVEKGYFEGEENNVYLFVRE